MKQFKLFIIFLICPVLAVAQEWTLRGTVKDETNETLPGVSVSIKGTSRGTVTDINGDYEIKVAKGETVIFRYVGYSDQQHKISDQKRIDVTLGNDDTDLEELVVVGYGVQSKRTVTSSISKLDGKSLKDAPINTVGEGMKGKIAGVRVYNSDNSPGSEATFLIRGGSSISQSTEPLILVDGVERDLAGINPNDIESIEVLKDAASSAIYGSRASNGVVLITTRNGKPGDIRITFQASLANEEVERRIQYLNSEDAIRLVRDRIATSKNPARNYLDGYAYSSGNTNASKFSTRYLQPGESVPQGWKSMADPLDPSQTLIFEDNDWAAKSYRNALWQNYYVGVDGGTERVNYVASIGYTKDSGVAVGTGYNRFSARTNVKSKIRKNLTLTTNIDYSQTNTQAFASQYQVINRGLMTPTTQRWTYVSDDEWYGTPTTGPNSAAPNALFYDYYNDNNNRVNRLGLNGMLDWEIINGLHLVGTGSLFVQGANKTSFHRADPLNGVRSSSASKNNVQRKKFEVYANYHKGFGNHAISVTAGYSYQKDEYNNFSATTTEHPTDKIPTLNAGPNRTATSSTLEYDVNIGYFGRVTYDFKKKYLLTATFREDGSSRFQNGHQWGFFPGMSLGWVMSDEEFMSGLRPALNNWKWRVSYGKTGNNSIGRYDALGLYAQATNYDGEAAVTSSAMPNPTLKWETTTQLDLGFDLGLLDNRIQLTADYFNKVTDNLITSKTLPNTSGFSSVLTNIGKVRFYGFDLELTTRNISNRNLTWETTLTMTFVKNKVLKLPYNGRDRNRQGGYTVTMADGSTIQFGGTAEGEPLGRMYGYMHDFIITTKEQAENARYDSNSKGWDWTTGTSLGTGKKTIGDYEWKDLNGDGVINSSDMFLLGNTLPTTTGGIGNTLTWKGFTFNIYFDFAIGHSISNGYLQRQMCNFMDMNTTLPTEILKCWDVGDDPSKAKYARYSGNDSDELNKNFRDNSDIFVQKADYLCLREVSLNYDIPVKIIKPLGMRSASVTIAGNNLHYFTGVIGMSPEMGATSTYSTSFNPFPPIRKYSVGLKVTF